MMGEWLGDKRHGRGRCEYRKDVDTVYDGEWYMGQRHGVGTLRFKDGTSYEGGFTIDARTGIGKYSYSDGSYYEGCIVGVNERGMVCSTRLSIGIRLPFSSVMIRSMVVAV